MTIVSIVSVKLSEVGQGKRIARVVVRELSLNQEMDVTVWLNDAQWTFKEGVTVEMDMRKGKPYKGKDQYSCNIEGVKEVNGIIEVKGGGIGLSPSPIATPPKNDIDKQDIWDKKDRRMCRMNALAHAVEVIKLYLPRSTQDTPLTTSEITGLIQVEAESFENWIYRNDLSSDKVGFPQ